MAKHSTKYVPQNEEFSHPHKLFYSFTYKTSANSP